MHGVCTAASLPAGSDANEEVYVNLSNLPTWFWYAAAAIAFVVAKRKGWLAGLLDQVPATPILPVPPASPTPTAAPPPTNQVVEIRHVAGSAGDASPSAGSDGLAETRRVDFGFDVTIVPRPKEKH